MKSTHLWLVLVGFYNFQIFPDRTSRARSMDVRSLSLSSESAVKYPHVGSTKGEDQMFSPPGEQDRSNALPPPPLPPLPPAGFTLIGA